MPTPGFPDWLGPGAIVIDSATHERDSSETRYVVMSAELQLRNTTRNRHSIEPAHIVALRPLIEGSAQVNMGDMHTVNLSAFLDLYRWTGEYFMPDGTVIGVGTTMPVSMHMGAIVAGEIVVVQGGAFDGQHFTITRVDHQIVFDPLATTRTEYQTFQGYNVNNTPDGVWEPFDEAEPFEEPMDPDPTRPTVRAGQVWLLPQPNQGRWRTSVNPVYHGVELRHVVEQTVMRCSPSWLIEHGVRQEPPDPRQNAQGQIVYGQVWEFTKGKRAGRHRVMEIDEAAGRVRLLNENGSGKRLYMKPTEILRMGTYVGDGLPRRTSFERILEADDSE